MEIKQAALRNEFDQDFADASEVLDRARLCAKLSKPWLLPPLGHTKNDRLADNYQSVGSDGLTIFVGKMLSVIFPPFPWFRYELAPELLHNPEIPDEFKQQADRVLLLNQMTLMSLIENTKQSKKQRRKATFRTTAFQALSQTVGTGDVLMSMGDDYRCKVYRRDQWTCLRDSTGDVLKYMVKERIDPLSLSEEKRAKAELSQSVWETKTPKDRMEDLYTRVQWQQDTQTWVIEQELNGRIISESEEEVSPYWSTPFELVPGENYGRGLIEQNLGDLSGLDQQEEKLLDIIAAASKMLFAKDESSNVRDEDLQKPSGSTIRADVKGGKVQDVGILSFAMPTEFNILTSAIVRKTQQLGKAMLMEQASQPQKDRVTALQIQRIAQELDAATGGAAATVMDNMQMPLLARAEFQAERDNLLQPIPDGAANIVASTGMAALEQGAVMREALELAQIASQLGPQAMAKIDGGVLIDVIARHKAFYEPGLIKSNQQLAEEQQAAQQQALAQQVQSKTVDVLGNAAQTELAANTQQGDAPA